jgi:hypothetical protein
MKIRSKRQGKNHKPVSYAGWLFAGQQGPKTYVQWFCEEFSSEPDES